MVTDGTGMRGTVCDDGFTAASADAICRRMGYDRHAWWGTPDDSTQWEYQWKVEILLSDVDCKGEVWETCSATVNPINCSHDEDVFLRCVGEESPTTTPSSWLVT